MEFWEGMVVCPEYETLGKFITQVMGLPQSTAEVKRTFSKVNANKTKLRNCLSVRTLEGILKTAENFPVQVTIF